VSEPIFSDLHELAQFKSAIAGLVRGSPDWRRVLAAMESRALVVKGMSRWNQLSNAHGL
jgi:hypothetical protein